MARQTWTTPVASGVMKVRSAQASSETSPPISSKDMTSTHKNRLTDRSKQPIFEPER
jgi:hypothetical protein